MTATTALILPIDKKTKLRGKITFDKGTKNPPGVLSRFPVLKIPERPSVYYLHDAVGVGREIFPKDPGLTFWEACLSFLEEKDPFQNLQMMNVRCANRYLKYPELFPKEWKNNWVYFLEERLTATHCSYLMLRIRSVSKLVDLQSKPILECGTIPMNTVFDDQGIVACFDLKRGKV